jgi:hypothetical protein
MIVPDLAGTSKIINGPDIDRRSFRPEGWRFVVLPVGLGLDEQTRRVLNDSSPTEQAPLAYVFGCRAEFDEQPSLELSDLSDLERISYSTVLAHIDTAIVAASGHWAAMCSPEGFTLLGAEPRIIEDLERAWGGRVALRAEVISGVESNQIGWGEPVRLLMQHLFRQIGWPLHADWPESL